MSKKLKIGVLMGGLSAEHEVSLATGQNVVDNLDRSKYEPIAIRMSKEKAWFVKGRKTTEVQALASCDVVFNALHGTFGEDGRVQALMEYYGARYTGSGITASALAMDKLRSREIFKLAGLAVPKTLKIRKGENYQALLNVFVNKVTNFPIVVKPCSNGSSVGVGIASDQISLGKALNLAFRVEKKILVEEFIEGREVTCGVLDGQQITALPVTEIIPKMGNKFFNYKAKYKAGQSDEITPARLDDDTTKQVQEIAVKAHQLLGCKAYSRTDMIIRNIRQDQLEFGRAPNAGNIYVLETNTLPGLTSASLLPKAALAAGLTFPQLLDTIIASSLI
ncbi:MAG: D-alanine--D-alanine ligase [Candidatus Taylorbacteria bacterium]|nr:D-alanine--D-alanine ligase [Candidatus Taylorbacteria bacterium]